MPLLVNIFQVGNQYLLDFPGIFRFMEYNAMLLLDKKAYMVKPKMHAYGTIIFEMFC